MITKKAKLELVSGFISQRETVLPEAGKFTIGRDRRRSLPIMSRKVSREHAVIECGNGNYVVVDWKTGKEKHDFKQIDLMFAMVCAHHPEVESATGLYYWTKTKNVSVARYKKADLMGIWADFLPAQNRMQKAFNEDLWETRPNGLCRNWCGYKECQHNGS